jgi:hypothetical protein
MLQILKKTNIDFIGKRYYAFVISGILVIFGLAAFVAIFLGKADLGIPSPGESQLFSDQGEGHHRRGSHPNIFEYFKRAGQRISAEQI